MSVEGPVSGAGKRTDVGGTTAPPKLSSRLVDSPRFLLKLNRASFTTVGFTVQVAPNVRVVVLTWSSNFVLTLKELPARCSNCDGE